jgi:hypothetical protein
MGVAMVRFATIPLLIVLGAIAAPAVAFAHRHNEASESRAQEAAEHHHHHFFGFYDYWYPYPGYYDYPSPTVLRVESPTEIWISKPVPGTDNCREYQTTIVVDGKAQPAHGTACRQADGAWRIAP